MLPTQCMYSIFLTEQKQEILKIYKGSTIPNIASFHATNPT